MYHQLVLDMCFVYETPHKTDIWPVYDISLNSSWTETTPTTLNTEMCFLQSPLTILRLYIYVVRKQTILTDFYDRLQTRGTSSSLHACI
jgi:hypothetical protein